MTGSSVSTLEKLLSLIDDIELIAKELLENTVAPKHQKISVTEHGQLTELLVAKDKELKDTLKLAAEQAKINQKMDILNAEVERQDQDIRQLQRQLKEAEQILATAIYQAKQKLQSISRANKRPVASEELIKFAHRISASNAVCAPLSWQQGDPRRPYPTDIEMRLGLLGRLSDLPINGHLLVQQQQQHQQGGLDGLHRPTEPPNSQQGTFSWHPSGDLHMTVGGGPGGGGATVAMETGRGHKENVEDVEVMSTDSSSSSSSDSQ
ncbi:mediator of RNA polymerase II transcription subunit 4 [Hetaerina americana]|uniref:mediator of RNA polymerase II transcription subunit 4 n=1 Tax=Hetaerina americana TaxID=62018 RepID=UPI003A7F1796